MSAKLTIGFLGAGKMATALAKGLVQAKLVNADQIIASDSIDAARAAFAKEVGVKATASNLETTQSAQVLVLAVKPDQVAGVLKEIRASLGFQDLPIVVLSNSELQTDVSAAYALGASAFHKKPTRYKELVSLLRSVITLWHNGRSSPSLRRSKEI